MSAEIRPDRRWRVLVADDSAVMRRMLLEALASEPAIDVVGCAVHGREALELFDALAPDLVTLDVEMPELDGLAALREIKKRRPRVPVVMFSSLTVKGAKTTLAALFAGASDFVPKPAGANGADAARAEIRATLIPKILALCEGAACGPETASRPEPRAREVKPAGVGDTTVFRPAPRWDGAPAAIVAIGVSTGGPAALAKLLSGLGADCSAPLLVVQHMPPIYTRHLAENLSRQCELDVREAVPGDVPRPGECLIAPGDQHMLLEEHAGGARIALHQGAPENSCRPAVDVLFRSVAASFGSRGLAVVLTGMGQDGLAGGRSVRAAGGAVLAQDHASSVVWGMPGAIVKEGLAERVLDLDGLASEIVRRTRPHPLARAS